MCSAVTANESGTSPSVCTTNRWRRCAGQVAHELGVVAARVGQPLHRAASAAFGSRSASASAGVEDQLGVGDAEDLEHVVELDLLAAVGDELLERAERVAEAAGRGAGDHADRRVGHLDPLLAPRPGCSTLGDLLERRALEVEAVAAVDDRGRHLVRLGRGEHEHDVRAAAPRASSGTRSTPRSRACAPRRGCRRAGRRSSARARRSRAARGCRRPSCSRRRPSRPRRARCRP